MRLLTVPFGIVMSNLAIQLRYDYVLDYFAYTTLFDISKKLYYTMLQTAKCQWHTIWGSKGSETPHDYSYIINCSIIMN